MFHFRNYSAKSKYYNNSNALVAFTVKDELRGVAIEELWAKFKNVFDFNEGIVVNIKK